MPYSSLLESLVFVSILALSTLFIVYRFWLWFRLRHIPGPFWAQLSGLWLLRHTVAGNYPFALYDASKSYGPLFRIGPNNVATADPAMVVKMGAVKSPYRRSSIYHALRFRPGSDNLLSTRDEDVHRKLKAKTAAGYAGKEVEGLEGLIDEQVDSFVRLIERNYLSTAGDYKPVDLGRLSQYFTMDVITAVAFGSPFGFLDTDSDVHQYIKMTEDYMPFLGVGLVSPFVVKLMEWPILKSFAPKEGDKYGMGKIMGIAKEVVDERFGPNKKVQKDVLGIFLAHGLTQDEAYSETIVQIIAGSDTTATALRATFLHTITSPPTHCALRKEIDEAIKNGSASSPITDVEARKLPYLQAVIKEGLRIWPGVAGSNGKNVPPGGDVVNGYFLPGGTRLSTCVWGIQRSKEIFGPDAEMFRPERWLEIGEGEDEKTRLKRMNSTVDLVFNTGRWTCPGRPVANIELNKIFFELFRRFDITIANPTKPWTSYNTSTFIQKNLMVRITRRTAHSLNKT